MVLSSLNNSLNGVPVRDANVDLDSLPERLGNVVQPGQGRGLQPLVLLRLLLKERVGRSVEGSVDAEVRRSRLEEGRGQDGEEDDEVAVERETLFRVGEGEEARFGVGGVLDPPRSAGGFIGRKMVGLRLTRQSR